MSQPQQSTIRNRLLNRLTPDDFVLFAPGLEPVSLSLRETLITPHEPIRWAYFPEDGMASFVADTAQGRIEIGLVGREGLVGLPLVLGTDRTPHRAIVQAAGEALCIEATALRTAFDESRTLHGVLGRYAQSLMVQVGQTVYANASLNLEGRLARWILMTHDILQTDELPMTHEFLSMMLAVHRPGVTTATHILEGAGMIKPKRGQISVLDREKLT